MQINRGQHIKFKKHYIKFPQQGVTTNCLAISSFLPRHTKMFSWENAWLMLNFIEN